MGIAKTKKAAAIKPKTKKKSVFKVVMQEGKDAATELIEAINKMAAKTQAA